MEEAAVSSLKRLVTVIAFGLCVLVGAIAIPIETVQVVLLIVLILVVLPLIVVLGVDAGSAIRDAPSASVLLRAVGVSLAIPQAFLGLVSLVIGASLIAWVAYNTFIQRMPQYRGGPIPFLGVGPLFVVVGWWWLRSAFERTSRSRVPVEDPDSTSPDSEPFH